MKFLRILTPATGERNGRTHADASKGNERDKCALSVRENRLVWAKRLKVIQGPVETDRRLPE